MKKYNIVLIGFMATGKTAVGRMLAKKLGMKYVSTDSLIEKTEGKKISAIFKKSGEAYFRLLETKALKSLTNKKGLVISCGGGIVTRPVNRRILKSLGTVVLLEASPEIIDKRLKKLKQRPLLDIKDSKERLAAIRRLLRRRRPQYRTSSRISVDTSGLNVRQVVDLIFRNTA